MFQPPLRSFGCQVGGGSCPTGHIEHVPLAAPELPVSSLMRPNSCSSFRVGLPRITNQSFNLTTYIVSFRGLDGRGPPGALCSVNTALTLGQQDLVETSATSSTTLSNGGQQLKETTGFSTRLSLSPTLPSKFTMADRVNYSWKLSTKSFSLRLPFRGTRVSAGFWVRRTKDVIPEHPGNIANVPHSCGL
jgi:hypothetical protein